MRLKSFCTGMKNVPLWSADEDKGVVQVWRHEHSGVRWLGVHGAVEGVSQLEMLCWKPDGQPEGPPAPALCSQPASAAPAPGIPAAGWADRRHTNELAGIAVSGVGGPAEQSRVLYEDSRLPPGANDTRGKVRSVQTVNLRADGTLPRVVEGPLTGLPPPPHTRLMVR